LEKRGGEEGERNRGKEVGEVGEQGRGKKGRRKSILTKFP
jgi:hypothetical protein